LLVTFASDYGEERQHSGNGGIILETSQAILSFIQSLFSTGKSFITFFVDGDDRPMILPGLLRTC
jgi:hypothetical protein